MELSGPDAHDGAAPAAPTGQVWDVLVVGTGPAGSSAARVAAERGARVLLLDRAELPRYKRCGGGLIGVSQSELVRAGVDLPALSRDLVGRLTFTLRGGRAVDRTAPAFLPMVLRSELDLALVELATAAGATLQTATTVTGYAQDGGLVRVATSGGELVARHVVGADGSASRAAAHVGVVCEQVDLGLEAEFPAPAGSDWSGRVGLDWGPVPGSYGWVFPKGDTLTVGVIGDRGQGAGLRDYYHGYVASLGLALSDAQHDGGHLTRVRAPGSPLQRGGVLVAGDAAGLLDPWTREGISFALRSGRLAGEAVTGGPDYTEAVEAELGPEVAAGRRALAAFVRHPGLVHEVVRRVPAAWPLFVRLVSGRTTMAEQAARRRVDLPLRLLSRARRGSS